MYLIIIFIGSGKLLEPVTWNNLINNSNTAETEMECQSWRTRYQIISNYIIIISNCQFYLITLFCYRRTQLDCQHSKEAGEATNCYCSARAVLFLRIKTSYYSFNYFTTACRAFIRVETARQEKSLTIKRSAG